MNKIFNEARLTYQGQVLTTSEITTILAEMPCSKSGLFITELVSNHALKRVRKGRYMFTEFPVHLNVLETVISNIRKRQNGYEKKYLAKKKSEIVSPSNEIQKAIDLLLSTGDYEIFKIEKVVTVKKTQL
jgi:hypothetical protein